MLLGVMAAGKESWVGVTGRQCVVLRGVLRWRFLPTPMGD